MTHALLEEAPQLVVVGGPNGCGKTTFARYYARTETLPYLGADDIAFEMAPHDPASVRVKAGREFSRRLSAALAEGASLVIESTLAGASLARTVAAARSAGYRVTIILVFLDSAGKYSRIGDAERVRHWVEASSASGGVAQMTGGRR